MPDNRHEINVRIDSSLYQLESILESLQGLVQGGLASFFNDIGKIDPRRVERLKYLLGQLNQSQASRDIGENLQSVVDRVETMASALQIGVKIKAPVLEPIFPKLLQNFNESIQKQYDNINQYITQIFSTMQIKDTESYIPHLMRSTRSDVATQLSSRTRGEIENYVAEFRKEKLDEDTQARYADYFAKFNSTKKQEEKNVINQQLESILSPKKSVPQVDFKLGGEAVTNYTVSKDQIGISPQFAKLTPRAKNFLTQHELGHSIFTRFQNLFPQRFDQIIHSEVVGNWENNEFRGVFGHEKNNPHETLADLYAYFMTNPRGMEKALPKQYDFIDQFLSREIFQSDVMNFAYSKIKPEQAEEIRNLFDTGQYTKSALAKQFGISQRQINRIINYESWAPPGIASLNRPPTMGSVYLGKIEPKPIITPRPKSLITELPTPPPKPIILPGQPTEAPKNIIIPTAGETRRYGYIPPPKETLPKEKPTQEVTNRSLEMMNRWLEGEYRVSSQLLKETRDGKKDSQKQAFDLKHLMAISAEARVESIKDAQERLQDIYVATGQDRPLTESFIRENIADDTYTKTASHISTLLSNQGLKPHQVSQLTDKYMKLLQDSLPPPPPPPTDTPSNWGWGEAARGAGKYALTSLVGGAFNAMDVIVDKAGLALSDIISRGMTINENLYYPMEMTMAGRMGRLMQTGMGAGFTDEFAEAVQRMWGQGIPLELSGTLMSNYTALLGSRSMENLANQLIPLTNIARATGMEPEKFVQPVAGMLRMMPERSSPQVYNQLSESIAKSIAGADLTKAIGTDELLKVFTTLSKNYFGGAAEITPEAVQSALSMVGYLTNFGAPGLQGAIGLENLAKLSQSLQGKGTTLTPLLYLGANFQDEGWGKTTLEKMVNISSRFSREGLFMRNEGTNEVFLISLLRQVKELTGGNQPAAISILSREGNISPDIAKALYDIEERLQEQLGSNYATPETLNTLVNSIIQGDQQAYKVMMQGTETEQMQYMELLKANTIYENLVKNTGQLPLQIAMKGKQQISPLMDKVYSALAEGAQGNISGAFKQLVQAFKEIPGIDREGASLMAYSALRNAGMTPQSLIEGLQRAIPQMVGTTIGAALGPTIASNISTILPIVIPLVAAAVGTYLLTGNYYKDFYTKQRESFQDKEYIHNEIRPRLEKEEKSPEVIKEQLELYELIRNYKGISEEKRKSKPHQAITKEAIKMQNFNTLVDVWHDVQGTDFAKPFQEMLEIAGVYQRVIDSSDLHPINEQSISPIPEKPLTPTAEKPLTPTPTPSVSPIPEKPLTPTAEKPLTPTPTPSVSPIPEKPLTPTAEKPLTPTPTPSVSPIPEKPLTPTAEKPLTPTPTPSVSPIPEKPLTPTAEKPLTPTPTPSVSPIPEKPLTPTAEKPLTPTPTPSVSPIPEKPLTPTAEKPLTPTPTPSVSPIPEKPLTPTPTPSVSPIPEKPLTPTAEKSISPLSEKPLVNEAPNKSVTSTGPQQITNTNYFSFNINAELLPGETTEEMTKRLAEEIKRRIDESQGTDTRNRNGGQQ